MEAWLLADAERLAGFLGVKPSGIHLNPEELDDPKSAMVGLARASQRRDIRLDMAPRPESGRQVGPAYASRLIEFASQLWRPDVAACRSESLRRAQKCLNGLTRLLSGV